MRLLVIADVGGEATRHIGDEAMLEANLDAFRNLLPNVAFTVVSRDPAWTAARYGVEGAALVGFPRHPRAQAERRALLDRLLAGQQHPTVDAVAGADGVVVSGGGNLSSSWPDLLYERVALLQLARKLGKPAVVLGQTIGPRLRDEERRLLADSLSSARFAGVRELPSAALALELGVPMERLWYQTDDALKCGWGQTPTTLNSIAVTIDPLVRARAAVFNPLIAQLRELSQATGAQLVLIPHVFGDDSLPSDLTEARVIAERLALPSTAIAAGLDAHEVRALTGAASLIVSTRYHPIVFGLGAGVPAIGIYGDEYCRIKLQGAQAHARLDRWTLTYDDVARGALLPGALELWRTRDDVRRDLGPRLDAWREESRERWTAVLRALDPAQAIPAAGPSTMFGRPIDAVAPALAAALEARRKAWEWEQQSVEREMRLRRALRGYVSALRVKVRTLFATRPAVTPSQRRNGPAS
ncbi:MAG TPA: polysaccharide pyruvyl transferase family protein [Thermoanaerobaculia bacterium]|nr:polysaccharide pyruvyl transferase family protein [Thermoanaerobaculia bacterium]